MRILFVTAFNGIYPRTVFPIGPAYLASYLRTKGHEAEILDLSFYNNDPDILYGKLSTYAPDIIGMTVRDVDSSGRDILLNPWGEFYLAEYKPLVKVCKKYNCPVVLGGPGFSIFPAEILKYFNLKLGIAGEGEHSFVKLISLLQKNKPLNNLPGLFIYHENKIYSKAPRYIRNLNGLPFPARDVSGEIQTLIGNIQTKRGCNLSCIYCSYPTVDGKRIRLRSPRSVADEFEIMVKSEGFEYIFIVDSVFNNPADHAQEICKELIRRKIKVQWGCNANPGLMTPGLLKIMKKAGCYDIIFGTDSLCDKMLKNIGKNFDIDLLTRINISAKKYELKFVHSLTIGGPGENNDTLNETLVNIEKLDPPLGMGISHGLRIYPGTKLERIAVKEGLLRPGTNLLKPYYYVSPQIKKNLYEYAKKFIPYLAKTKNKTLLVDELENKIKKITHANDFR